MSEARAAPLPQIVDEDAWRAARADLLVKEKEATRLLDALAAERRRLPMVEVRSDYVFDGPAGPVTFLDLFEGRPQLIVYHFMFAPGAKAGCDGCSMMVDDMSHPAHLHARDVSLALVSRARIDELERFRVRMGWTLPWVSSYRNDFNRDFGVTTDAGETFALSVFVRDGGRVFRSYVTDRRGVEALGSAFSFLDLVPYGRQEDWEDSPDGWPQGRRYVWWRHHDRYGDLEPPSRTLAAAAASLVDES